MITQPALHVAAGGNAAFDHLNLDEPDVQAFVNELREQGCEVKPFPSGYSCEINGDQVFRALRMENSSRYHVRTLRSAFARSRIS